MSVIICLDEEDQIRAFRAAKKRFLHHSQKDTPHYYGKVGRKLAEEVESIGAEIATAKAIGVEWQDNGNAQADRDEGDLGNKIDVRFTQYPNGRLLLHERDYDDHIYFLTTGGFPLYEVVGYILGKAGKMIGRWAELQPNRPCYLVDQCELKQLTKILQN